MDTDQFAKLALGEAKCSPSGSHHDGQMGPPALFITAFNNFFAAHELAHPANAKNMKCYSYCIKNVININLKIYQNYTNFKINNYFIVYLFINAFINIFQEA